MGENIPDAVEHRCWKESDGPRPRVHCWPRTGRPALYVRSHNRWRYAPVEARQDWADGSVVYQVAVDLRGDTTVSSRAYAWPQPGLRLAHTPGPADGYEAGAGARP
ncbi:hypothetical protein ACLQ2N_32865 [Streptomyces sp. DT224]|uniref:hypothetical protein n=1 Tax=Streptomyces sp. DT224 TaxID=3393426 RepID=UPI003CEACA12